MPFLHTTDLLAALQARLESLQLADGEAKVFERVGVFGARELDAALRATFASEARVCFIVPAGDDHRNVRQSMLLTSVRSTGIVLLIADRSLDQARQAALVGGAHVVGILDLKDLVVDSLVGTPFPPIEADAAGHAVDIACEPGHGAPLLVEAKPGNLGREVWAQELTVYAGELRAAVPV